VRSEIELVLQVNGKVRGSLTVPADADRAAIEAAAPPARSWPSSPPVPHRRRSSWCRAVSSTSCSEARGLESADRDNEWIDRTWDAAVSSPSAPRRGGGIAGWLRLPYAR
jgi:leucyl-tRNA synthetase